MTALNQLLIHALQENKITLPEPAIKKLVHYLELMKIWNRVFNLTTITEPHRMVYLHIIDSLSVQNFLHGKHMLDVGSGAGLPGIPLAIANPDQNWTLLDKNNKKTRFMTQAIAELGLTNATAIHSRCEDFHPSISFDSILSRAFGSLRMFVESTQHLLSEDGRFIAMKGKYPQDEINDLPAHIVLQQDVQLKVKGMDMERHVICFSKK
jgi:16S rRNA (guanine527-N7)-methyltransferase